MPRPCKRRRVCALPERLRFGPAGQSAGEPIRMGVDEFETIRLIDLEGLTQEQLAEIVGVRRETIMRLEKAQYNPSLKLAVDISRAVGVPIQDIFVFP